MREKICYATIQRHRKLVPFLLKNYNEIAYDLSVKIPVTMHETIVNMGIILDIAEDINTVMACHKRLVQLKQETTETKINFDQLRSELKEKLDLAIKKLDSSNTNFMKIFDSEKYQQEIQLNRDKYEKKPVLCQEQETEETESRASKRLRTGSK